MTKYWAVNEMAEICFLRVVVQQQRIGARNHLKRRRFWLMDRLAQISKELIALHRQQLNWWVLGKINQMDEIDMLQYDRRRERIDYLRKELEGMTLPQH
jgi:hypothetical protein